MFVLIICSFILSSQTIQDDLVKQASEGLIPNGKLRTPVADILGPQNNNEDSIFSKTIDDLLPVEEDTTKPIADTTTMILLDFEEFLIMSATAFMRSTVPTDVPPNF